MIATYDDIENDNLIVWFNGQNITGCCAQFEKLYTQGISYWGDAWVLVRIFGMIAQPVDGPEIVHSGVPGIGGAVQKMRGILVWQIIEKPNFGAAGLEEEDA